MQLKQDKMEQEEYDRIANEIRYEDIKRKYQCGEETNKKFMDLIMNDFGQLCRMLYNPITKRCEFEPL